MNPDTPSFEMCKRLAAAGWPQDPNAGTREFWFRYRRSQEPELGTHRDALNVFGNPDTECYAAPTLAEMLAEVTRRGWGWSLKQKQSQAKVVASIRMARYKQVWMGDESPADALAKALADALEATKP